MNRLALTRLVNITMVAVAAISCTSAAQTPKIELVPAFPALEFDRPLFLTHAGDSSGRLFVVEQPGRIHVFPDSAGVGRTTVFLDITAKVRTAHDEEGLLALAFHPMYSENRQFFVWYSASAPRRTVLSRFHVSAKDADRADPSSEAILLEVEQPYGNHNGGMLLFGPDDYLYLSLGDGGSAGDPHGHGQNPGTLLGSILRLDVDRADSGLSYAIPHDNPFVGQAGKRGEIWAFGLRNVWRMSFDRVTQYLWAGDVGQDKWEEIDLIVKGGNYGWNAREGAHAYRSVDTKLTVIDPVSEYDHYAGASVTGGYVYRGRRYPQLAGMYLYADYVTGTIWGLHYANGRVLEQKTLLEQPRNISSFGENQDGELFVTCFDGKAYRIAVLPD